ncbi:heavy metal-associated isoprenylated plant protein 26-like [Solanum tuberosum]|uniref:heavy metal-associated isoprenylated plant protein 26-like n=1 Tax=Solanum tuberosum TaxID=4113 RepID=UPI00073A5012|nr:PREDICTED: heavy metal-associated isoprenylated plant protein 26-like [Solanum tuberosum]
MGCKTSGCGLKATESNSNRICGAKKVFKAAQSTGKKCEIWPYVPYSMVAHPYAAGVYDKKAPPNFVRATTDPSVAHLNPVEEQYSLMFSDENLNACNIM